MKELKKSPYKKVKAAVLGSRDELCIHPDVKNLKTNDEKIDKCQLLRDENNCEFYKNLTGDVGPLKEPILDIEDLCKYGKQNHCCPYFMSRKRTEEAKIIFMPYNYLFVPKLRDTMEIDMKNAVVIIDEAHNIPDVCLNAASKHISTKNISNALDGLDYIIENSSTMEAGANDLKKSLSDLFKKLIDIKTGTKHGGFIFELLESVEIDMHSIDMLGKLIKFLKTQPKNDHGLQKLDGLRNIQDFLKIIFWSADQDFDSERDRANFLDRLNRLYKVHAEVEEEEEKEEEEEAAAEEGNGRKIILHFICLSPAIGMHSLLAQNLHSLIMTSGTLAPLEPFAKELEIEIPIQLEIPSHIIDQEQVFARILSRGVDIGPFDSIKKHMGIAYLLTIGRTLLKLSEVIPDGILVFFRQYDVMEKCVETWQDQNEGDIWSNIEEQKKIFVESKNRDEFKQSMNDYVAKINEQNSKGAIFMAVARGKVSEGLNFSDKYGRCVMMVGLPLRTWSDLKIKLRREYFDKNPQIGFAGRDWCYLDACRAANQAIGRVIRHRNDYGAILLCDDRIGQYKSNFSSWIKEHLSRQHPEETFQSMWTNLDTFFLNAKKMYPEPKEIAFEEVYNDEAATNDEDSEENNDETISSQATNSSIGELCGEGTPSKRLKMEDNNVNQTQTVFD
ncbi:regulator of telomere elongation helicase 1 homolog isoform X2 [Sitodiplosis mosellana]|nr:regulator of telomere elongation helicase 1 homolog isoform X2 [Sitodiplosis mosellana]